MIDEVIPVWKPVNWTSFDVVKKVRNQIKPSKVGHAGSLDPFAEGVLMLCTGKCTKQVENFMDKEKEYIANIKLGIQTDTLDLTGRILKKTDIPTLTKKKINDVLNQFIGNIKQMPPMYSALKIKGVRLYKFARQGITIDRQFRKIQIYKIDLLRFTKDSIKIKVICGRGTYIRSLAEDIAKKLGTEGHLTNLSRIRIGEYDKESCIELRKFPEWLSSKNY